MTARESSQKLIVRGSTGDDSEEGPYENGRSSQKINGGFDLDA